MLMHTPPWLFPSPLTTLKMKLKSQGHNIGYCEPVQAGSDTPLEKFQVGELREKQHSEQCLVSLCPKAEVLCGLHRCEF